MNRLPIFLFVFLLAAGCADPISVETEAPAVESQRFTPPDPATKNLKISEIVAASVESTGEFSVLLEALQATGLDAAVDGKTIFTVVAPTNDAFAALGLDESNVGGVEGLSNILLYHVIPGRYPASRVLSQSSLTMANGGTLTVNAGSASFTDAAGRTSNIIMTDIAARNGIIHVIDAVVLP